MMRQEVLIKRNSLEEGVVRPKESRFDPGRETKGGGGAGERSGNLALKESGQDPR